MTQEPASVPPSTNVRVYIIRKGNGGAYAVPSPQMIANNGTLTFFNLTDCKVTVDFSTSKLAVKPTKVGVLRGSPQPVTVSGAQGYYYEYQITLDCGDCGTFSVEGASDPGLIIEP